jgi:hypothetical protein
MHLTTRAAARFPPELPPDKAIRVGSTLGKKVLMEGVPEVERNWNKPSGSAIQRMSA